MGEASGPRLILSRKGFDSDFGGRPSPILPDGQMVSLPIPDPGSDLRYADCHLPDGSSYLELLQRLGIETIRYSNGPTVTKVPVGGEPSAHLDSDLSPSTLPGRPAGVHCSGRWIGLRATCATKASVLVICSCSLACSARRVDSRAGAFVMPGSATDPCAVGLARGGPCRTCHRRVGGRTAMGSRSSHWRARHLDRYRRHNTMYLARERSTLLPGLAGGGVFIGYQPLLRLSRPGSTRPVWRLPLGLHPDQTRVPLTGQSMNAWSMEGDAAVLRSAGRGQEFVVGMHEDLQERIRVLLTTGSHQ
jgi:hypothetical protein